MERATPVSARSFLEELLRDKISDRKALLARISGARASEAGEARALRCWR